MKGVRLGHNLRITVSRIETREENLRERIEALKRKIKQTRQYASSVSRLAFHFNFPLLFHILCSCTNLHH